jgi:HSP20 family molecular chaperone IbpA
MTSFVKQFLVDEHGKIVLSIKVTNDTLMIEGIPENWRTEAGHPATGMAAPIPQVVEAAGSAFEEKKRAQSTKSWMTRRPVPGTELQRVDTDGERSLWQAAVPTVGPDTAPVWGGSEAFVPPIDVIDSPDKCQVFVELPGMRRDADLTLDRVGRELWIRGNKPLAGRPENPASAAVHAGRRGGPFAVRVILPPGVPEYDEDDEDLAMSAILDSGLLTVTVPKSAARRARVAIDIV